MEQFINVRINNAHGLVFLKELEALGVISIEKKEKQPAKAFNGKQFRGIVPKNESEKFKNHLENIRSEWERDI
jgi:hypothetical protein